MAKPPTRGQWLIMSFMSSGWFVLVLAMSVAFFAVLAVAGGGALCVMLALFGAFVLGLNLLMRSTSTYDLRTSSRTLPVDDVTARRLVLSAIAPMEPDQVPETDADGFVSIDCWRVGATLGVHLAATFATTEEGTRVDASSRLHLRQPPSKRHVTADVLREFDEALARIAKAKRAAT